MSEIIDVVKECWMENPLRCIADFAIVVGIFTLILIVLHFLKGGSKMEENKKAAETKSEEVVEKKWYQKTWVIATGLILTHAIAGAVGYVIGASSGDESGEVSEADQV